MMQISDEIQSVVLSIFKENYSSLHLGFYFLSPSDNQTDCQGNSWGTFSPHNVNFELCL